MAVSAFDFMQQDCALVEVMHAVVMWHVLVSIS